MYKRGQRFKEPTIDGNRDHVDFESLEDEDLAEYLRACKNSRKYSGYSTFYKGEDGQYDFQTQYSHMDKNNKDGNWLLDRKLEVESQSQSKQKQPNRRRNHIA